MSGQNHAFLKLGQKMEGCRQHLEQLGHGAKYMGLIAHQCIPRQGLAT